MIVGEVGSGYGGREGMGFLVCWVGRSNLDRITGTTILLTI